MLIGDGITYSIKANGMNIFALVERGNLCKMEHDEPLDFTDIEEEAKFFQKLGMSSKLNQSLRVPDAVEAGFVVSYKTEKFDIASALKCIHLGEGHKMKLPAASCTLAKPRRGIFSSFALDYFGNQRFPNLP